MRAIRRRQQQDPAYMYDTPLPKPAANTAVGQDPLAASLGELAPAALRRA
jgi:hypothetical protein